MEFSFINIHKIVNAHSYTPVLSKNLKFVEIWVVKLLQFVVFFFYLVPLQHFWMVHPYAGFHGAEYLAC